MTIDTERMTEKLQDRWGEIVLAIVDEAHRRFRAVGAETDFCIQHADMESIIFGGWNRVVWSAKSGYRPDESSCTALFLANWKLLQERGW
jgi:hypothetical protein